MANKVKDISNLGEVQTAIKSTVNNLSTLLNLSNRLYPSLPSFCGVKLLLEDRNIAFRPAFKDGEDRKTVESMILEWINSFLMSRIRVDVGVGDCVIEIMENEIVYKLYNEVNELSKESDSRMKNILRF